MPEGPELYFAARFINSVCKGVLFGGKIVKSEVSKCPEVSWCASEYQISATSRGKELKLEVREQRASKASKKSKPDPVKSIAIVFRFGMSGRFRFDPVDEMHKHAHLNFITKDKKMVLSFVDARRFGSWDVSGDWGSGRGPCVIKEYDIFRDNVLTNLDNAVFNKPVCEALLDQRYFNGIGNYLRAEILYRASVAPFVKARDVLEKCQEQTKLPDLLELCSTIPAEVLNLTNSSGYDPESDDTTKSAFMSWLRCYYNPEMNNMVDHNKRTIWFQGKPGPMTPKDAKKRHSQAALSKPASKAAFESKVKTEDIEKEDRKKTVKKRVSQRQGQTPPPQHDQQPETQPITTRQPRKKRTSAHDWPTSPRKLRSQQVAKTG